MEADRRKRRIARSAGIALLANVLLSAGKAVIGYLTGSVAVMADAANNLSDAAGSVAVLLSAYFASRPKDSGHPYGHGRLEYISALSVGFLIFFMAVDVLRSSLRSILHPEISELTSSMVWLMVLAVAVKLVLFFYQRHMGNQLSSQPLKAESKDSLMDAVITLGMLAGLVIQKRTGLALDGYLGIVIGFVVVMEGISVCRENGNRLLGSTPDAQQGRAILDILSRYPEILGVHDLQIHDYAPCSVRRSPMQKWMQVQRCLRRIR